MNALGTTKRETSSDPKCLRRLDLASNESISSLDLSDIGYAVLLAGITNISFCDQFPEAARLINVIGSKALVERLRILDIPCLLISSSSVFDEQAIETSEYSPRDPSCVYGLQKKELEDIVFQGERNLVVRASKVWGVGSGILKDWLQVLQQGGQIQAFCDLYVAPLHIDSVCDYLLKAISCAYRGVAHVSSDSQVSYFEMAQQFCSFLDLDAEHNVERLSCKGDPRVIYQPKRAYLDCLLPASLSLSLREQLWTIFDDALPAFPEADTDSLL
jgi:dTDP-4-dehydrorhamnose reductase